MIRICLYALFAFSCAVAKKHHNYAKQAAHVGQSDSTQEFPDEARSLADEHSVDGPVKCTFANCGPGFCDETVVKRCVCPTGYSGERCEVKNGRTCTDGEKQHAGTCSKRGFLCPWVHCDDCERCEEKVATKYASGDLEGCIKDEKCVLKNGGVVKYQGKDCSCEKELVNVTLGKCLIETCRNKVCPEPPPPKDPCHEVKPKKNNCECDTYRQVHRSEFKQLGPNCGDRCTKYEVVDDECQPTCVDYEEVTTKKKCNENCQEAIEKKDAATCTKEVTCQDLEPGKIAELTGTCVLNLRGTPEFLGASCGTCPPPETIDLKDHKCTGLMEVICIDSPTCQKTEDCQPYEEPTSCTAEYAEKCPDECKKPFSCRCPDPVKECPAGTQAYYANCRLTNEECEKDPECCEQLCPTVKNGRRMEKECVDSCEVCSYMEGVTMSVAHQTWRNKQFCNSDEECCQRCMDASVVDTCPSDWSSEKKTKCKCPNA